MNQDIVYFRTEDRDHTGCRPRSARVGGKRGGRVLCLIFGDDHIPCGVSYAVPRAQLMEMRLLRTDIH